MKYNLLILFLLLKSYLRMHCQIQTHKDLRAIFSSKSFVDLNLIYEVVVSFYTNFCIWCEVGVQHHSFACGYLVYLNSIC